MERVEQAPLATEPPSSWRVATGRVATGADTTRFTHCIRVVRAADGQPIAGADVTLRDNQKWTIPPGGCRPPVDLRTDQQGELLLQFDRSVVAIVRIPGFCAGAKEIEVAGEPLAEVTIALYPVATIAGRVVDAAGAPVAGAEVAALGHFARERGPIWHGCDNGWPSWNCDLGTSDSDGRFGPVACYAGSTTAFEVTHEGHTVWLAGLALDAAHGPAFDVELCLPPRVELVVRAVRPDGLPAHGDALNAKVTRCFEVFDAIDRWHPLENDGRAIFQFNAPGLHRIEVGPCGFDALLAIGTTEIEVVVPWSEEWGDAEDAEDEDVADEAAGGDDDDDDDEPASEPGTIRGTAGCDCAIDEPCDSLRVVVRRDGVEVDRCDWFNEEGFEFDDLAPGCYVLALEGAGHRRVEAGAIALEPGGAVVLPRLVAPANRQLRGRRADARGRPLDAIEVALVSAHDPIDERCVGLTDEAGRFRIPRLDGSCFLDVLDYQIGNFRVAVPSEPPDDWVVTLPAPRRIAGIVVAPFGVPLDWIKLSWWERPDPARHAELLRPIGDLIRGEQRLDRDGRFTIERAPSGECVLELGLDDLRINVARRVLPAGSDVDLGRWELPAVR